MPHIVFETNPLASPLPPITDMINVVRTYIWQRSHKMVNIQLNMADEHSELIKLEKAYYIANNWLIENPLR